MPPVGQPETISVVWTNAQGQTYDPPATRLSYSGPGVPETEITTPDARITHNGAAGSGSYSFTLPTQTQAGVWLYRWDALDGSGNVIGSTPDGSVVFTASGFVEQQPGTFPYPYGYILQNATDFAAVRDQLGFQPVELPDTMIGEPEFEPAAETWVWQRVPNWALIMGLGEPPAPVLAAQASAASMLLPSTYYVRLVARVGATASEAGVEASQAIAAGQQLAVTAPQVPGVTSFDGYVGVAPGLEFLQPSLVNMQPGSTANLTSFGMTGTPVQAVGLGDETALKAATAALTCSFLCRRFQRYAPAMIRTMTYSEEYRHDWRQEEAAYLRNANLYLGLISTYQIRPPAGLTLAHPPAGPTDPYYQRGADPLALPNPFETNLAPPQGP